MNPIPLHPAGPKSPPAGSTVSKVAVSDGAQLKSLLGFKGAVDGTNILKSQWTASGDHLMRLGGWVGEGGGWVGGCGVPPTVFGLGGWMGGWVWLWDMAARA